MTPFRFDIMVQMYINVQENLIKSLYIDVAKYSKVY